MSLILIVVCVLVLMTQIFRFKTSSSLSHLILSIPAAIYLSYSALKALSTQLTPEIMSLVIIVYSITLLIILISVFKVNAFLAFLIISIRAVGEGCGGRKPCVTESDASIGSPIYTAGILYFKATEKISGTTNTKPTL